MLCPKKGCGMRRRQFITALGGAAAWPLVARAQQLGKIFRIGVVCPISCETSELRSFREALAALGYKDGANVVFEYRSFRCSQAAIASWSSRPSTVSRRSTHSETS